MHMKLFVTGGAGFIGSNFIRYWLSEHPNDTIVNVDALTYAGNLENLHDVAKNPRYAFVRADVTDASAMRTHMAGADVVVHFAAESHVDRSILDAAPFIRTNVLGTHVMLEAARTLGVKKYIQISTDEVFGDLPHDPEKKFSESSPYAPSSPYAASKAAGDHLSRAYARTYGTLAIVTHSGNNMGPYQFPEKFIPLVIANALAGKKIPVYGNGSQVRTWVHVDDHVRALDAVITGGRAGETYCIGGEERTNSDVARAILSLAGAGDDLISYVDDRPGHDRRYAIDDGKIRRELGWRPRYSFTDALRHTVEWYQNNGAWLGRVLDASYRDYYDRQYGARDAVGSDQKNNHGKHTEK